jgi:hypothetical protein
MSGEEEVTPILNALISRWQSLKLEEENSLMLNALGEIRTFIDV